MAERHDSILGPENVAGTLMQSQTMFIGAIDPDGRVLLWNRGAEEILGWQEEEVLGRELPAIFPEDRDKFQRLRERVLSGEAIEGYRMAHRCRDGSSVDLILSLRAVRGKQGRLRAILGLGSTPAQDEGVDRRTNRMDALELQILQHRLPTHFLLNALHNLGVVVRKEDRDTAVKLVTELGDMLRHILSTDPGEEVPLRDELAFVERYVEVEGLRRDRPVSVRIEVAPGTVEARVPALVLQPLVENALRHGLVGHGGEGRLQVRAQRHGERLEIRIEDNGRGLPPGWAEDEGGGMGLKIVRARLARLYGPDHRLELSPARGGGVAVVMDLPYRGPEGRVNGKS